jgi:site-specific DNA recombinase
METHPKFFLYARKSTDESNRQVLSIEAQLFELREMAKREGIAIIREFVESRTAKQPGRPIFNEMLSHIEAGMAEGIIAWHPDRLARNSMDGGRIIYLVDIGKIRDLKFPTFRFDPTAQGKFMLSIAFSQSKYYVDNLSENIKRGIRQKLRNGVWPSWAPVGYVNDKAKRCIAVEEGKAPLIRKTFELYATGHYTLVEIRNRINALGLTGRRGRRLGTANYHFMLRNPVYYGMIRFNDEIYEGKHAPIISKKLFDRVQSALEQKSKPKSPGLKAYRYRGFFRCGECGCFITTETQKGHNYLRCTKRKGPCNQRYVREEPVAEQIVAEIATVSLRPDWADNMLAAVAKEQEAMREAAKRTVERLTTELSDCEAKLDTLLDMVLNKTISQSEYAPKKQLLLNQKADLREKLACLEGKSAKRFEPLTEFINEAKQAVFLAKEKNPDACRDFLKKHGSNFLLTNQRVRVEFKNPWKILAEINSAPPTTVAPQREIIENKNWRRERDSNPRYL